MSRPMNLDELMAALAARFALEGADYDEALWTLKRQAMRSCRNIMDRYMRFGDMGRDDSPGWLIDSVSQDPSDKNVFHAAVSINGFDGRVKAAELTLTVE